MTGTREFAPLWRICARCLSFASSHSSPGSTVPSPQNGAGPVVAVSESESESDVEVAADVDVVGSTPEVVESDSLALPLPLLVSVVVDASVVDASVVVAPPDVVVVAPVSPSSPEQPASKKATTQPALKPLIL
jgi:hypothetical protein